MFIYWSCPSLLKAQSCLRTSAIPYLSSSNIHSLWKHNFECKIEIYNLHHPINVHFTIYSNGGIMWQNSTFVKIKKLHKRYKRLLKCILKLGWSAFYKAIVSAPNAWLIWVIAASHANAVRDSKTAHKTLPRQSC